LAARFAAEGMRVVLADVDAGAHAEAEAELAATGAKHAVTRLTEGLYHDP
jgi:hypothetical protein